MHVWTRLKGGRLVEFEPSSGVDASEQRIMSRTAATVRRGWLSKEKFKGCTPVVAAAIR